jgi:hypothetical protein
MSYEIQSLLDKAAQKKRLLDQATREYREAQAVVEAFQRTCNHSWDHPEGKYDPIYHPGYSYPGDKPGTMGVDFRPGGYVDARTEDRWTRTCTRCGKVETTTATRDIVKKEPRW